MDKTKGEKMKDGAIIRYSESTVFGKSEAYIFINDQKFLHTNDLDFAEKICKELLTIPRAIDWHLS